jgi:hypothetical protein
MGLRGKDVQASRFTVCGAAAVHWQMWGQKWVAFNSGFGGYAQYSWLCCSCERIRDVFHDDPLLRRHGQMVQRLKCSGQQAYLIVVVTNFSGVRLRSCAVHYNSSCRQESILLQHPKSKESKELQCVRQ